MRTDNDTTPVEYSESKPNKKSKALITLLPFLSLLSVVLFGMIRDASGIEIGKVSILTLILTAAFVFFLRLQEEEILKKKYAISIITISYLLSIFLIMLPLRPEVFSFWMIGGLIVSMLLDGKLGLLVYFNLTFILSITLSLRPETTIHFLVMGVLMSLLSNALKSKFTVIYAAIILLSTNITLSFVINNFVFEESTNFNYLSSFFSISAMITVAFLLSQLYLKVLAKEREEEEEVVQTTPEVISLNLSEDLTKASVDETITNEEHQILYDRNARTSYELLMEEQNELMSRMKTFSQSLYQHSMQIGELSARAARIIGADELLARVGGMYHEVGKINGKNYIEEGLKLAEEFGFTKELKAILKQHNIKYEKPTSVEAAIVMLSDNVVSTIDYIRKTEENKFTLDKIIENIFQLRMEKGTFDDSGLSVKDYKILKEFYQNEFK